MSVSSVFEVPEDIQKELLENEGILWAGRPGLGIRFDRVDIFNIPFSIAWWGVVIFVLLPNFRFSIFVAFFAIVGIYVTIGRFFYDKWKRDKTFYVVTPSRVIIKRGILDTEIRSFDIATLVDLDLSERADGSGTIKLESESPLAGFIVRGFSADKAPGLEYITDARYVYELILQQKHKKNYQD